ncbi:MAG: hypothetical protein FD177_1018 [Desulfovibrionaceae bacterium]|nr:MAG: hypothetical protein FD177_1018 [Desulfovibrionaceae bacterium]
MPEKKNAGWSLWFRPGSSGWIKVLAFKLPVGRSGKYAFHLDWCESEKRFAEGKELKLLKPADRVEIESHLAEARKAGWL